MQLLADDVRKPQLAGFLLVVRAFPERAVEAEIWLYIAALSASLPLSVRMPECVGYPVNIGGLDFSFLARHCFGLFWDLRTEN